MYEVRFKCKLITPLFMSGAYNGSRDTNYVDIPELRGQSIKGLLRFWWRTIYIDVLQEYKYSDYKKLLSKENMIWGGEINNKRKNKSIVTINIENKIMTSDVINEIKDEIKENKGIEYLYYSVIFLNKRKCIAPNKEFYITLKSFCEKDLYEALMSLWALSFLGGMGSRARKGAGNFLIEEVDIISDNLREEIKEYFTNVSPENLIDKFLKVIFLNERNYPKENLEKNLKDRLFIKQFKNNNTNWKSVLNYVGERIIDFRSRDKKTSKAPGQDYYIEENFLLDQHVDKQIYERSILGLPIKGKFRKNNKVISYLINEYHYIRGNNKNKKNRQINEFIVNLKQNDNGRWRDIRLASPLFISINENNKDGYYAVFFIKSVPDIRNNIQLSIYNKNRNKKQNTKRYELNFNTSNQIIRDLINYI